MKTLKKVFNVLPFEEGKSYKTKFATGEMFLLTKIKKDKQGKITGAEGIYENCKHLGVCPLDIERLIHEIKDFSEIEVCSECGEVL